MGVPGRLGPVRGDPAGSGPVPGRLGR